MAARALVLLAVLAAALTACSSPEAGRSRGGGPGGDVGNRGAVVQMHEGSLPFRETPRLIGDVGMTDLEPARQAQRLSRAAR